MVGLRYTRQHDLGIVKLWNSYLSMAQISMFEIKDKKLRCTWPVEMGSLTVSRFFIDHGSDINSRNGDGFNSLHLASRYGHVAVARMLIDCGADVNTSKEDQWTLLHLASHSGHLGTAKLLIDRGANVDRQNVKQETPLDLASWFG